jgi:hypothetical protein
MRQRAGGGLTHVVYALRPWKETRARGYCDVDGDSIAWPYPIWQDRAARFCAELEVYARAGKREGVYAQW